MSTWTAACATFLQDTVEVLTVQGYVHRAVRPGVHQATAEEEACTAVMV
jgi:hypothetical protein